MEIFDLDGHNLGTVFHYHPIITGYLEIECRSHGSKGLTFSNDHSKAEIIKRFVQEKTMSTKGIRENNHTALNKLINEITVDAYGDDEELWAFRQVFEDDVNLPADGFVMDRKKISSAMAYE